jgi:adiponectin receptor
MLICVSPPVFLYVYFPLIENSYHIFLDHSSSIRTSTCRFDYLGIVIPLYGTTIAATHFGFRREPRLQDVYQLIATVSAIACAIATFHPTFTKHRHLRTSLYCLLGLSSFLPIIHGVLLHGMQEHDQQMSLRYYLALGVCHATGAMVYAARVPERWYPRRFDVWGSSHQVMHVLVVLGAGTYGMGVLRAGGRWGEEST